MKFSAIFKRRKLQFRFPITVDKIEKFCNSKAWYMKGNYQKQRQLKLTQKTYEKKYITEAVHSLVVMPYKPAPRKNISTAKHLNVKQAEIIEAFNSTSR